MAAENYNIRSLSDIIKLSSKELGDLCKRLDVPRKGNKSTRVTGICERLGLRTTLVDKEEENDKENLSESILLARQVAKSDHGWTKDIRQMPKITLREVTTYLLRSPSHNNGSNFEVFGKEKLVRYKTLRSYRLWREDHIHSLQYHSFNGDIALVRCKSIASFEKQGTEYKTFVALSKTTCEILYGHCYCVAGLGEACTHVAGLLFAIEEFISEGLSELPGDLSSTDKLCKWIVPKGPKEMPKRVSDINFTKLYHGKIEKPTSNIKDPRADKDKTIDFNSVRLLLFNLQTAGSSNVPVVPMLNSYLDGDTPFEKQFTSPSAPYPIEEVEVFTDSPPLTILERCCTIISENPPYYNNMDELISHLSVDEFYINKVEELTRGQSMNSNWKSYRRNVCTASNIQAVCTRVNSYLQGNCSNGGAVLKLITGSSPFGGNASTKYGIENEPSARQDYLNYMRSQHKHFICIEKGFIYHQCGYIGASPDGISHCDCHKSCLLEIKCPVTLKDKDPMLHLKEIDFLILNGQNEILLKPSHKYYHQIITTMAVTNTKICHLVIWSPKGMVLVQVEFSETHFQEILEKAKMYFKYFILPTILDSTTTISAK